MLRSPNLPAARASHDLDQTAAAHVVDRAGDRDVAWYERRLAQSLDIGAHAGFEVAEWQEVPPGGVRTQIGFDLRDEIRVLEGQHPTVGVVDDDDLVGP